MDYNEPVSAMNVAPAHAAGNASGYTHDSVGAYVAREQKLQSFASIDAMLKALLPAQSVQCMHPEKITAAARMFVENFSGDALYAVKSNPDPYVLQHLYAAGIRHFDVASLGEVKQIHDMFPDAHLAYMNPVKSRESIRAAYNDYGVRDYVLDTQDELKKIVEATNSAGDLTLVVRIAMPKGSAACALTAKFGCTPDEGVRLLREAAKVAAKVGVSFHVGSQTLDPQSYADAIRKAGEVIKKSGIKMAVFDVGGGFPIQGLGMEIRPMTDYFKVIDEEIKKLDLPETCRVWSEPGRALCGSSMTLVVRVELRKGNVLYINDGSYGNMFEICSMSWKNAVQMMRPARKGRKASDVGMTEFHFYGPTCDSVDYMPGPFLLPDDINDGDWIAIQGAGAYTSASRSHFNGIYSDFQVEIAETAASVKPSKKQSAAHLKLVKSGKEGGQ